MGKTMPHTAHPALEAERERAQRAQYAALTAHYGNIGSAALVAALICAQHKVDDTRSEHHTSKAA